MNIRDITKHLNVSVATVSRALNPKTENKVAEKTRALIKEYVKKHQFIPNRSARELATGRTNTIGVILPTVFESIFFKDHLVKVLSGIHSILNENTQYQCKLITLPKGETLSTTQENELANGIDGLLVSSYCDHNLSNSHYVPKNFLNKLNRPIVLLNLKSKPRNHMYSVYYDNKEAAYQAVTYLIKKGHTRIAFIKGNNDFVDYMRREEGYHTALEDHNIPIRSSWTSRGNFNVNGGYQSTLELFKGSRTKPTAIFCINDEMAIGAISALKSMGIKCPNDVSILGFDGIDAGEFTTPRLTTMAQPTQNIAQVATNLLIQAIENKLKDYTPQNIPTKLIIRDSA